MSRPIIFRPLAKAELDEAIHWYEKQKAGLGLDLRVAVEQMLIRMADAPERFRAVRGEVRRALLQRFPYAIHFLPEPKAIIVVAVFHTKRDPRRLEGRG